MLTPLKKSHVQDEQRIDYLMFIYKYVMTSQINTMTENFLQGILRKKNRQLEPISVESWSPR